MVQKLIQWAVNSPLIVLLMALALAAVGAYAFINVNVEAYPDPAPAIIEVIAQMPGASAEEVERQVTIPLEVTLAGMPGLKYTRSKSLAGLSHLRNQFEYGIDYNRAKQEVINRLQFTEPLPPRVTPQISPTSTIGWDYLVQGHTAMNVRGLALLGGGQDPTVHVLSLGDPQAAAAYLRAEEQRRLHEIREIVITAVNNVPICIDDLVEGGPMRYL